MVFRLKRVRIAHDVSVDVAAGGNRIEERIVDCADGRFEISFDDSVELERLAGGQFECAVGSFVADFVECEPLFGRADSARDSNPGHERVGGFEDRKSTRLNYS